MKLSQELYMHGNVWIAFLFLEFFSIMYKAYAERPKFQPPFGKLNDVLSLRYKLLDKVYG